MKPSAYKEKKNKEKPIGVKERMCGRRPWSGEHGGKERGRSHLEGPRDACLHFYVDVPVSLATTTTRPRHAHRHVKNTNAHTHTQVTSCARRTSMRRKEKAQEAWALTETTKTNVVDPTRGGDGKSNPW